MDNIKPHISVIIPVYGARDCLVELHKRLVLSLEKINNNFEIILINDGCPQNSWEVIKELSCKDTKVKGINFSRNFGQHHAITAGIDYARGEWVVIMDCDLQDRPEEIEKLYNKASEGYDIVFGRRVNRQDTFIKTLTSRIFYKIYDYFTDNISDSSVSNFSISRECVIKNLRSLRESNRSFLLLVKWCGFNAVFVDIDHSKRFCGKTSYNFSKLKNLAIDSIIYHSNKPLKLSIKFGFMMCLTSLVYGAYLTMRYYLLNIQVHGWTSLMVSLFFLFGLLFANMGILGLYTGKIFDEIKGRPIYIIKEKTGNLDNGKNYI